MGRPRRRADRPIQILERVCTLAAVYIGALERSVSGAENGAERAKKSDERSGAVSGSRKKRAERSGAERRAGGHGAGAERERSGERR